MSDCLFAADTLSATLLLISCHCVTESITASGWHEHRLWLSAPRVLPIIKPNLRLIFLRFSAQRLELFAGCTSGFRVESHFTVLELPLMLSWAQTVLGGRLFRNYSNGAAAGTVVTKW